MKTALLRLDDGKALCAPGVGVFEYAVQAGDALRAGRVLGTLRVLNRLVPVLVPAGCEGVVAEAPPPGRHAVAYGQVLVHVGDPVAGRAADAVAVAASKEDGHAIVSPIDGIFYCRPTPDAEAFVSEGGRVTEGRTLGLIEVMKTFNPVRYGGIGAPPEGVVLRVEVVDQAEVRAGQTLFVVV